MSDCRQNGVTGLIFSKDRAMQLRASIESLLLNCRDHGQIQLHVLYKTSSPLHRRQYERLKAKFHDICFVEEADFKEQVLSIIGGCEHILFAVDDNMFVRDFFLSDVVGSLRSSSDSIGFSLRLGVNTTYCYARNASQAVPAFQQVDDHILKYDWTWGEYDFGYPLEVSSSVYRSVDILGLLGKLEFDNPNTLEGTMAANAHLYRGLRSNLLCFEKSAAFCVPVNMVQTVWQNRVCGDGRYSVERLAQIFEQGGRIDVERYSDFVPNSCHQEVELCFDDSSEAGPVGHESDDWTPEFSVITANYNNAAYIGQAIESVRNQTFKDWELIVVEDCSTDNSRAVIEPYLGDGRIRLIEHSSNQGYTAALKTGIANVRSEYFGILDSDDALVPHAIETMYQWHERLADCGFIYSQFAFCDKDLIEKRPGFCAAIPAGRTSLDAHVVSHFKTFKLRDYLKTGGYDENILYAEDVDIVYRMEEVTKLRFVDDCMYLYRDRPNSVCRSAEKINVAIMSRVKARINALKRRCGVRAGRENIGFGELFGRAVAEARAKHDDVEQYFVILTKLYAGGMLANVRWPAGATAWRREDAVLWLAANVDIQFDKLFKLIGQGKAGQSRPLVSVEMTAYNSERHIGQAIDSVLAQTYRNFELLIVDDGSTDGTAEIVASYSDERIRYIRLPHRNCALARNRAISEARGEYLLCVDSDDFIETGYVEKMVAFAECHGEADYFYPSSLSPVDEAGKATQEQWSYHDFSDNRVLPAFLFDKGYGPIPNPGSLKRRSLFERVGGYDDVDSVEDFVFLCKHALKIRFMRVDEHAKYFYRRLPDGSSHNFRARNRIMAAMLNEMVLLYRPEVLCPQIAGVNSGVKEREYVQYLMRTFYRHAEGGMVKYGEYFREYGDYYRRKLPDMSQSNIAAEPTGAL
ncbi:MAG: glycosyltransferase [Sedimentisphaerales bacterium]|nr:glycosyltransferase [Sedimentisphaerales bacterium]